MATQLQSLVIQPPWRGVDLSAGAMEQNKAVGQLCHNFLVGRNGKLYLRGPIGNNIPHAIASASPGYWQWGAKIMYNDGTVIANNRVIDLNGFSVSAAFAKPNGQSMTTRWAQLGDYTYGITNGSTALYRWDGSAVAGGLTLVSNGPLGVRDCINFANRLICLGGSVPGGAPGNLFYDRIYWTDPNWTGVDTLVSWQDDVTSLTNQIVVDPQPLTAGSSSTLHSLVVFDNSLYILGLGGIWEMRGSGPSNWTIRKVSATPVMLQNYHTSDRNAVATEEGIYFESPVGITLFDGSRTRMVAPQARPLMHLGGTIGIHDFDNEWLAFNHTDYAMYLYHRPTGALCQMSSAMLTGNTLPDAIRVPAAFGGQPILLDGTHCLLAQSVAQPDQIRNWSVGGVFQNMGQDQDTAGTDFDITGTVRSRLYDLGGIKDDVQFNRFYATVKLTQRAVTGTTASMTINLKDEAGNTIATTSITSDTTPGRKVAVITDFSENSAFYVEWIIDTNQQNVYECEILDCIMQYQVTRPRTD